MTAKEYLNQAYKIDRRIQITLAKAEKMRSGITYKSPSFDSAGSPQGGSDKLSEAIAKVVDYEREANELINKLVSKRIEIEQTIQSVQDAVQREVLERRYLLYQQWESRFDERTGEYIKGIAEEMGFSRRRIFQIHGEALKTLHQIALNCTYDL